MNTGEVVRIHKNVPGPFDRPRVTPYIPEEEPVFDPPRAPTKPEEQPIPVPNWPVKVPEKVETS